MPARETNNRTRYLFLAILFLIAFAFQFGLWSDDLADFLAQPNPIASLFTATWDIVLIMHVFAPVAALLLGFYVALVRIEDHRAWLLLAVLLTFSFQAQGSDVHDRIMTWNTPLKHLALFYRTAAMRSWSIWMMLFTVYFPERAAFDVRRPHLKWIVLVPLLVLYLVAVGVRVAANEGGGELQPSYQFLQYISFFATMFLYWFGILTFLAILLAKAIQTKEPDAQRRLRVLFFGLAITLLPTFILDTVVHIFHLQEDAMPAWILIPVSLSFALFPVTLAYVTVVQRALDVRVILRQSLQYALAKRGVVIIQSAISLLVIVCVAHFSGAATFTIRILITAAGVAAILFVGLGARRLAGWIDRKFFRDAYQTEQVLTQLADSVRSIVELEPLLQTVVSRISEALHVSSMAVFLRENNRYQPAWATGNSTSPRTSFSENGAFVKELRARHKPLPVYLEDLYLQDRRSWLTKLDETETAHLRELDTQLLLPLSRRDELLGFLSLGAKASEAPYSSADLDLLQSVASQTSLAIENTRLTAAVAEQTAERKVLASELAIARDVQQRLFPQVLPSVADIEYCGACRPAREIGGDYYDFLELPGPAFGIAIGDVSGKGVPAALLMAGLQATLRGQTASGEYNLSQLIGNMNRAVYATSPANRYATFFYGHYQLAQRRLHYVNAGHNAPILLRGQEVIRLDAGGPPIGLLPHSEFQSAHIDLQAGDLLLLYTDGISEAMNAAEEEWGEEQLIQTCRQSNGATPALLLEKIFAAADQFAAGAAQHDDMTLIVLRYKGAEC